MLELPRSPRAARTRSAMVSVGIGLLAERPIDAIAIDEIVVAAGVAKGSFFNHFGDKGSFASAVYDDVRGELETWVAHANGGCENPVERLAGGMIAAAAFAFARPGATAVLARSFGGRSIETHPSNAGLLHDLRDGLAAKKIELPSEEAGVLYWLGTCHTVMSMIVQSRANKAAAIKLLATMLQMGLRGLGADRGEIEAVATPPLLTRRFGMLLSAGMG